MADDTRVPQSFGPALQPIRLAKLRPIEAIEGDESKADHRNDKAARHIEFISDVSHQLRENGSAHDRHHDEGRSLFGSGPQSENSQSEDGREHDRHEEIAQENAN